MRRVTADTNICISALNFSGNPRRVLDLADGKLVHLSISDPILDEVSTVLRRKKFGWPDHQIKAPIDQIPRFAERVLLTQRIDVLIDDPADNRILECALASASTYLITGDRHLLQLGQFKTVRMVTPGDFFLDLFQQTAEQL